MLTGWFSQFQLKLEVNGRTKKGLTLQNCIAN